MGVLHCWGYAQASCLLLKLSALQSQTCLGLLLLRFLGNTALQSLLLECSEHLCLSFRLRYTLRTRKLLCASGGWGRRNSSGPVDSLSALSFLLPLKAFTKVNKAGPMPEPKAVFHPLQFPTNFLCRPGSDLSLTGATLNSSVPCLHCRGKRLQVNGCLGGRESNMVLLSNFSLHIICKMVLLSSAALCTFGWLRG